MGLDNADTHHTTMAIKQRLAEEMHKTWSTIAQEAKRALGDHFKHYNDTGYTIVIAEKHRRQLSDLVDSMRVLSENLERPAAPRPAGLGGPAKEPKESHWRLAGTH